MTNKIYECTDEQFVELIKNSINISEVLFKLGYSIKGNSWGFSQVRRRMDDLNLSPSDFKGKSTMLTKNKERNLTAEMLLKENDNRLENLRFLCPNCHSQTTTYGSRNQQRNDSKYEISEELRQLVESTYEKEKSINRVSAVLGIRRCVVTEIVNFSGQKHSNQRYVIRYDSNRNELARYGSLSECAKELIDEGIVKTKQVSTARRALQKNANTNVLWLNNYWVTLDGSGITNNPLLESSLIDSENNVDEAQAKAA